MIVSGPHPAAIDPRALVEQCDCRFTRRSGPGGQNRNKVETAVILQHRPTGVSAEASERRTQGENQRAALFRLRLNLALQLRTQHPADSGPSELWQSRCRGGKLSINPAHDDFPALLAEALDQLHARGFDPKHAAGALGCTPTQLIRLLKEEPRALLQINAARTEQGLHALK